eukprot:615591-Rhodomonas_salina.2
MARAAAAVRGDLLQDDPEARAGQGVRADPQGHAQGRDGMRDGVCRARFECARVRCEPVLSSRNLVVTCAMRSGTESACADQLAYGAHQGLPPRPGALSAYAPDTLSAYVPDTLSAYAPDTLSAHTPDTLSAYAPIPGRYAADRRSAVLRSRMEVYATDTSAVLRERMEVRGR